MNEIGVLIVGGGVAGLEALAAIRALAGDRVDVTVLSPERKFVNQSMCVEQPFRPQRVRGIKLEQVARDFHARWQRGTLDYVNHEQRYAVTEARERLHYDKLVLATGARYEPDFSDALTYRDGRDSANYRLLLHHLREGRVTKLAFVKPPGASWSLPLYDLVLQTAADCETHGRSDVELSLITPEEKPLRAFGPHVSDEVGRLLDKTGVRLYTSSYGIAGRPGWLDISPGGRRIRIDRVVTEPKLVGRRVRGIPFDSDTFIPTDVHGRVRGLEDAFAAGDATNFPVKQGGLAAQQADAVAETIAASVGVDIDPQPFRPVLRSVLLTGGPPCYLRADISGSGGDDSVISRDPLWWPPDKLAGRYLAPYISSQTGSALDVHTPVGARVTAVDPTIPEARAEQLTDLRKPLSTRFARFPSHQPTRATPAKSMTGD